MKEEELKNNAENLIKVFEVDMGDNIFDYEIIHSVIQVDNFYRKYREDLLLFKKYLFENRSLRYFIQVVEEYFNEYNDTPSFSEIYNSIERDYVEIDDKGNKKYSTWAKVLIDDLELIKNSIPKNDIFNESILKEKIMDRYENYIKLNINHRDKLKNLTLRLLFLQHNELTGRQYEFLTPKDYDSTITRSVIPTGISLIDRNGGVARSEIGIVMAPTGTGKSTCLMVIGANIAIKGMKVLHIVFEGVQNHYLNLLHRKISLEGIKDENHPIYSNWKLVKMDEGKSTIDDVIQSIKVFKEMNGGIDVVVIDYLDCIRPTKNGFKTTWEAEAEMVNVLENFCTDNNLVVWTAVQTNRSGLSSEEGDLNQVAGSKKKLDKACMVVSLNRTSEQKRGNMATLKLLKNRNGYTDSAVNITYNPNEMIIDADNELLLG